MKTVNIGDLKANLSAHLKLVRKGEEVLVCDRNTPVARIVPYRSSDHSEEMQDLIARGIVTPPLKPRPTPFSWPTPPGNIPDDVMQRIWDEDREDQEDQ
jgi:prevent-host-death family protein